MYSKKIVQDIFNKNNIKWEVKDFGNYINPKCKTANSIYDKLFRLYNNKPNKKTFSIADSKIDDLLRMTIIVDYNKVTTTIKTLKENFPDLTGYLQIEKAGYRGVHLNLKVDGLPCEIQLAPKIVVMAVDYLHNLYEKWRSFDYNKEILLIEERENTILNSVSNEQEKLNQLNLLDNDKHILEEKRQQELKDFKIRNKTYNEIFDIAGFSNYQLKINNQLEKINKEKSLPSLLTDEKLSNILNTNLLTNGKLDKEKVKEVTELIELNVASYQEKFVKLVKECLNLQ